jgi:hypothetical protein
MKQGVVTCLFIFCFNILHAQLPQLQKVCLEIEHMYSGGQSVFQSWRGPMARNLVNAEYESKYSFPGTKEPLIKLRNRNEKSPVYYYEGVIAEEKSITDIKKLFKEWETLLGGCKTSKCSLKPYGSSSKDENGIPPVAFIVVGSLAKGSEAASDGNPFRVQLSYEQTDEGLYTATIQIGCM